MKIYPLQFFSISTKLDENIIIAALPESAALSVKETAAKNQGEDKIALKKRISELIDKSNSNDTDTCAQANRELGTIKDESAMKALISNVKNASYWRAPGAAALALANFKDKPEVFEVLVWALENRESFPHWHQSLHTGVCMVLGEIGNKKAIGPLVRELMSEDDDSNRKNSQKKDYGSREAAREALKKLNWQPVIQEEQTKYLLFSPMHNEIKDFTVRLVWDPNTIALMKKAGPKPFIELLKSKDSQIHQLAIKALGETEDNEAIGPLADLFNNDKDASCLAESAKVLRKFHWEPAEQQKKVVFFMFNLDSDAIAAMGIPASEILGKLLQEDHSDSYKYYILEVLKKINNPASIRATIIASEDKDLSIRREAILILNKNIDNLLKDNNLREMAINSSIKCVNGSRYEFSDTIVAAASILGRLGDERVLELLKQRKSVLENTKGSPAYLLEPVNEAIKEIQKAQDIKKKTGK